MRYPALRALVTVLGTTPEAHAVLGQKHLRSRKKQDREQNVPCKQDLRSPAPADPACPAKVPRFRKKEKSRRPI